MAVLNTFISYRKYRSPEWLCRALPMMLVLLFFDKLASPAHAEIPKDYQVKAVFLFNFTQFIEWPTNTFATTNAPFTIGILGKDPFGKFLNETVHGEHANGHPIIIKQFSQAWDVKDCQILFVSQSEADKMKMILAKLKGKNLLTVSDMEGFAKNGGTVRFATEQNKIHIRVNLEAIKDAGLMVNSQLLHLAEIVEPGKD